MEITPIAHIRNDYTAKFGVPRQSGLVTEVVSDIVFTPEYRNADALRGLEDFSHLWLIWEFSLARQEGWSPTVRPPRLGGNQRMGVFATRSPFRPNRLGLSCVKLEAVETEPVLALLVSGCDMMDGTPVYDIKPYLPYADAHPEARGGFAPGPQEKRLQVVCPPEMLAKLPPESRAALPELLALDPRPAYQEDPERVYGFDYAGRQVRFRVAEGVLTVTEIE